MHNVTGRALEDDDDSAEFLLTFEQMSRCKFHQLSWVQKLARQSMFIL